MDGKKLRTYRDALEWIVAQPAWNWTAAWWRDAELIVQLPNRAPGKDVQAVKGGTGELPTGALALGCTGLNRDGLYDWLGWDFDVGEHGAIIGKDKDGREIRSSYPSIQAAISSAWGLWHYLDGAAEIRYSRSGNGVHVRTHLPSPLPKAQGVVIAKAAVDALGLRTDRTPTGRQQFWLWVRKPAHANSFKLITGPKTSA